MHGVKFGYLLSHVILSSARQPIGGASERIIAPPASALTGLWTRRLTALMFCQVMRCTGSKVVCFKIKGVTQVPAKYFTFHC